MAEHVYTPPASAPVRRVTPPLGAAILPFPTPWPSDVELDRLIRTVESLNPTALFGTASVAARLAAEPGMSIARRNAFALQAFLTLARALDEAGLCVADLIGGAA